MANRLIFPRFLLGASLRLTPAGLARIFAPREYFVTGKQLGASKSRKNELDLAPPSLRFPESDRLLEAAAKRLTLAPVIVRPLPGSNLVSSAYADLRSPWH